MLNTKPQKIAVIGTGMMGMSLAALFTGNGYDTTVLATKAASAERGRRSYDEMYAVLEGRGLVSRAQAAACAGNLHFTLSYVDLQDVDAVFECAVEDKAVKFAIYQQIEAHCKRFRFVASTTSAMAPETLCEGLQSCPGKLVVAHPFNPPHLVPFVELVKCACTEEAAASAAYEILESCGRKVCVMKKSAPGFIANRLQHALLREAIYMVEQGLADPRDIDKALMYSFMPRYTSVGLFEHQDAAGLDMVQSIEDHLLRDLSDAKETSAFVRERVARGDLGQKTGRGTYDWTDASRADFKARAAAPYWQYFNWDLPQV